MTFNYRNEYLFSEIYLEEITQIPEQAEVQASLTTLNEYRDYADTSNLHAWKESFVHQALYTLGFNIQAESDNVTLLFLMGSNDEPVSVLYILLPGENLDNTTMGRNWAEKIIRNLRDHEMQWGLLTNGEQWRIYHQDETKPYETYLEIDLAAILADNAREAYQIFHKFMRAENFTAGEDGQCRFDVFKKESQDKIDYIEKELENALKQKEQGGQGVLSSLCLGYVEYLRQNGNPDLENEELRRKIYHGAMLYMFRLLFLNYADARGLLSDDNHRMLADVRQAAYNMSHAENESEKSFRLWQDLETIFVDIDQTYNGGLFNPFESEFTLFIEEKKFLDVYLAPAVYHLAFYHEKSGEERLINYKDVNVRHLGTLYEGLLEHKLFIAKEDTEVRITKGLLKFVPQSKGGKAIQGRYIPRGQVYFGSDESERKSTGSYYTPEHIVEHMVKLTVSVRLEELWLEFNTANTETIHAIKIAVDEKEMESLSKLFADKLVQFINQRILSLRILDPAMGSGHYLVNSANKISIFITRILNELSLYSTEETSSLEWRRKIVENCIYGVDINPLAVALAKLSLWLSSISSEKPLSFLDHHLKCGDSLVGTKIPESLFENLENTKGVSLISKDGKQIHLFDGLFKGMLPKVLSGLLEITQYDSSTYDAVSNKNNIDESIHKEISPFVAIENLKINMQIFGKQSKDDFDRAISLIGQPDLLFDDNLVIESQNLASNRYYFHWYLLFPEIFFDPKGDFKGSRAGFDVVLGNPPYDVLNLSDGGYSEEVLNYLKTHSEYQIAKGGKLNLFRLFLARAISIVKKEGFVSLIIPFGFLGDTTSKKLREYILTNMSITLIDAFPERDDPNIRLFQDAKISTCIVFIKNNDLQDTFALRVHNGRSISQVDKQAFLDKDLITSLDPQNYSMPLISEAGLQIAKKICKYGNSIRDIGRCYEGEINLTFHKGYIRTDQNGNKLMLKGAAIQKYRILDKMSQGEIEFLDYMNYLRNVKSPKSMHHKFDRIVMQGITGVNEPTRLKMTILSKDTFCGNSANYILISTNELRPESLLGILNSKLLNWFFKLFSTNSNVNGYEVDNLPLPPIARINESDIANIVSEILSLTSSHDFSTSESTRLVVDNLENQIDKIVYKIFELSEEDILNIEGRM